MTTATRTAGFSAAAVLLALATVPGCQNQPAGAVAGAPQVGAAGSDQPTVKLVAVTRATLRRETTQPAIVHAYYQAEIYAKAAGYLKELHVDIGSHVDKNAPLGVLDVPETVKQHERQQAVVGRLKAEEKRAAAEIEVAKSGVKFAEAAQAQAGADIARANAQLAAEQAELDRVRDLVANKSVASRLLDEATNRYEAARAAKTAAEAAATTAQANVVVAQSKLAAAEADLETAQAETTVAKKQQEELEVLMAYATLTAPFAGVVTQRHVDLGDLVQNVQASSGKGGEPLFAVAQTDRVRIRVAVPERDAPWVSQGDAATVRLTALPGKAFPGEVSRVSGGLDESTRSMMVEIELPNADGTFLPGMFGQATITLVEHADRLVLPVSAIRFDEQGHSFVYVVNANNTVQVVEVTTGLDDGTQIEITGGLTGNERVAGATVGRLPAGQKVNVEK